MIGKLFGSGRKSMGQTLAMSFRPNAAWTPCNYIGFAREGFAQNPIAHRCVRLIAESASSCPLKVVGKGKGVEAVRALLAKPNPDQAQAEIFENLYGFLQVCGNAYLHIVDVQSDPKAIFILRPDRMRVKTGSKGWVDGWEYQNDGQRSVYVRDRVSGRSPILHMKLFNPADDYYGLSPMQVAARAVDIHSAGASWAKALLDNAARPSGALIVSGNEMGDNRLTQAQFKRLKDELESLYSGAQNAGRPLLLEGGLDWKPMGHSPAEMDFISARREAAREIALAFGVPPMILGLPGDITYSNYKEANLAFYRQTILPLVRKTALALSKFLKPWFGENIGIEADEDGLPALAEERFMRWQTVTAADFLTQSEKRTLLGLDAKS